MRIIIAIDPDCDKSGVATLNVETKKIEIKSMPFPKLVEFFKQISDTKTVVKIHVEAGWLNESNWHLNKFDSKAVAAAKGNAVGRNHETGRKICEMAKYFGLEVVEIKPLTKIWGPTGKEKISQEEISGFINGFPSRSNPETRDAALLAWSIAGLPIKFPVNGFKKRRNVCKSWKSVV